MAAVNTQVQESEINKSLTELVSQLRADNQKLRQQLKVMAVEMGSITNWIAMTSGVELINKESPAYKLLHMADEESEDIAKNLTRSAADFSAGDTNGHGGHNRGENFGIERFENEHSLIEIGSATNANGSRPEIRTQNKIMKNAVICLRRLDGEPSPQPGCKKSSHSKKSRCPLVTTGSKKRTSSKSCDKNLMSRTHTGEKPFKCTICDKAFQYKSSVRKHVRFCHENVRPHKCNVCKKGFACRSNLTIHRLVHSNSKPHVCDYCGARFNQVANKRRHESIHTGEKPFKCSFCDKSFRLKDGMEEHSRTHTKERPYKCNKNGCAKSFHSQNALKSHVKNCHTRSSE